eukprot:1377532-Pleurochrysis_carterae.AAC.10
MSLLAQSASVRMEPSRAATPPPLVYENVCEIVQFCIEHKENCEAQTAPPITAPQRVSKQFATRATAC